MNRKQQAEKALSTGDQASTKRDRGRPAYEPTDRDRQLVQVLAGCGVTAPGICRVVGISERTLYNKFREELDGGKEMVEAKLIGNLLKMALGNDAVALKATIFMLQARFGWSFLALPAPGKKEAAVLDAQTAHEESDWGRLVN